MMIVKTLAHIALANTRFVQGVVVMALLAILLPACANLAGERPAAGIERSAGAVEERINLHKFATPAGAEMDHFVGAIDDDLFIGIAVSDRIANDGARTLVVYLCDGRHVSHWIVEEIAGQETTLVAGDTVVELALAADNVAGTVALAGGVPQPFTAAPATGDAGLYRAQWALAGADYVVNWIVLADGRQRGALDGKGNDILVFQP
jgi:hypothetical protein